MKKEPLQFDDIPVDVYTNIVYKVAKHGCVTESIVRASNHPADSDKYLILAFSHSDISKQNKYIFWRYNMTYNVLHLKEECLSFQQASQMISKAMRDCFITCNLEVVESNA